MTPPQGLPVKPRRRRRTLLRRRPREHPYDADQDRSTGFDLEFVFSGARGLRVGVFRAQGFESSLVLMSPADKAYQALKAGEVDFVAAETHAALAVFPRWHGIKLICAQAQGRPSTTPCRSSPPRTGSSETLPRRPRLRSAPWLQATWR
jgi:hypothetical protein